jgi:hypothetical protein
MKYVQTSLFDGPFLIDDPGQPEAIVKLPSIEVYLDFRIKSYPTPPTWKAIRARVLQDGELGEDLIKPTLTNIDNVIGKVTSILSRYTDRIVIRFAPELRRKDATFDGRGRYLGAA